VLDSANFAQDLSVSGCTASLVQLRKARLSMPDWIAFRKGTVPLSNGYVKEMTIDTFVENVDPHSTVHVRSLVLGARLLWPGEPEKIYGLVRCSFGESKAGGLEHEKEFQAIWSIERNPEVNKEFAECILQKLLIMEQPLLWNMLPEIMTRELNLRVSPGSSMRVARYQLLQDVLTFWLDTVDLEISTTEYRLIFCTGDIVNPNGHGFIHNMYGMKRFFQQDGNINLMAEMLVERGITRKMRFDKALNDDSDQGMWRIFDESSGVWKYPKSDYEPEGIIAWFVEQELRPVKELEFFFGKEITWQRRRVTADQSLEGEAVEVGPEDSASQSGRSLGSKRSQSTVSALTSKMCKSSLSAVLFRFGQTLKDQTEIRKVLQHKICFSFNCAQKAYLLCCKNGLVDLRNGELKGRPSPDDLITQMCHLEYDPCADTGPAIKLFKDYFPVEAYLDQEDVVAFLQQFLGYSLSMETNLQMALFAYGNGSNGKSLLLEVLDKVLGKEICRSIPVESLDKARGQNNDALHDARHARLVTLSETNGPAKVNEANMRSLICGEPTTNKSMYKKEITFTPYMKLLFMANYPPAWMGGAFSTSRRMAYLKFRKIFVDVNRPQDRKEAEALKQTGAPECLIQPKDPLYYRNHVAGKEQSFLKFFVEGAKEYYSNNMSITIPESMVKIEEAEEFDIHEALEGFVTDRLYPRTGGLHFVSDLWEEFRASCITEFGQDIAVKFESFSVNNFGADLATIIEKKKTVPGTSQFWAFVEKKQVKKTVNGKLRSGKAWKNLEIRSMAELLPENRFATPGSVV
jgi:P4 family phage/plasmid primase-like protien